VKKKKLVCLKDNHEMELREKEKKARFRGVDVDYRSEFYVCPVCKAEAATIDQTAAIQKDISNAYRKKIGLLTGKEITDKRKNLKISQQELANRMQVGIASIKRWEGSQIQTKSMDKALREALAGKGSGNIYTGNRELSLGKVRLLLEKFESILGRRILKKGDKFLYAAKYAWYADMVAYREYGQSMTGSAYAALPYGPQINNYRDLIDEIKRADVSQAEPLTPEEIKIIKKIAMHFPRDNDVYTAAHKEVVWEEKTTGALISYSDAGRLTEVSS